MPDFAKCVIIASTTMTAGIGPQERSFVVRALSTKLDVLGLGRHILVQQMEDALSTIIQHLPPQGRVRIWKILVCWYLSNDAGQPW